MGPAGLGVASSLGAVALLEFFLAAARAKVIAANILQRVTRRFCVRVAAIGAVHMTLVVVMLMLLIVIVLAVGAVNVGFLLHGVYSGM
jgi:hypothetical protein